MGLAPGACKCDWHSKCPADGSEVWHSLTVHKCGQQHSFTNLGMQGGFERDFPSLQATKGRLRGRSTSDFFASWQPVSPISPAPSTDQWTSRLAEVPLSSHPRPGPVQATLEPTPVVPSSPLPPPRMADALQKVCSACEAQCHTSSHPNITLVCEGSCTAPVLWEPGRAL